MSRILETLDDFIGRRGNQVTAWFEDQFARTPAHVYGSVDLRHSGVKIAPVDTNLFPAGFNNLSESARERGARAMRALLAKRFPEAKRFLIVPENHTRNLHYLDSVHSLRCLLEAAGAEVALGSLMYDLAEPLVLESASGAHLTLEPLRRDNGLIRTASGFAPDVVVMNNDLTAGAPSLLVDIDQPIVPPLEVGWHRRRKSEHFRAYHRVVAQFAETFEIDPWLVSTNTHQCGQINFRERVGLGCVARAVEQVVHATREKYRAYGVPEEPYVFIKADSGTYGMGIMTATSGEDVMNINKKRRHSMQAVKGGSPNTEVVVQEGVVTVDVYAGKAAEPVVYLIGETPIGGFYRIGQHHQEHDNLNVAGATFTDMCEEVTDVIEPRRDDGPQPCNFRVFGLIGRLAALAAARERAL